MIILQARDPSRGRETVLAKTAHFFTNLMTVPFHCAANWLSDLTNSASRPRMSTSTAQGRRGSAVRDIYLGKNYLSINIMIMSLTFVNLERKAKL